VAKHENQKMVTSRQQFDIGMKFGIVTHTDPLICISSQNFELLEIEK